MGKSKGKKGKKKGGGAQPPAAASEPVAGSSSADPTPVEKVQPEPEERPKREVQEPPLTQSQASPALPVEEAGSMDKPGARTASGAASGGRGERDLGMTTAGFGRGGRGRGRGVQVHSAGPGEEPVGMAVQGSSASRREPEPSSQAIRTVSPPKQLQGAIPKQQPFPSAFPKQPPLQGAIPKQQPLPSAFPKQQPLQSAVPKQQPLQSAVPKQQPLQSAVPKQQPLQSADPKQQPLQSAVPKQQPFQSAVPKQQPLQSAVPKQQPLQIAVPKQQPLQSAVPKQQPLQSAVPKQQPLQSAVPKQQPLQSAVPKQQPLQSAVPKQQPLQSAVPKQQPLQSAVPKQQPLQSAVPKQQPQQSVVPKQQPQQSLQSPLPPTKELEGIKIVSKAPSKNPIPRPDFGKAGRPIKLRANFFPMRINGEITIYHYDVSVKPEVRNKAKMREIVKEFIKNSAEIFRNVYPVFDGKKNMYTHCELHFTGKHEREFKLEGDGVNARPFHVAIQLAARIPLYSLMQFLNGQTRENPQDAIQALDIVFREMPSNLFIPLAQYFFTDPGDNAGIGLQFWNGFYQSVRPTAWKTVMLQVDSSVRVFHKGQLVLTLLDEVLGQGAMNKPLSSRDHGNFQDHIRGLAVEIDTARYPMLTRRTYKLIGLSAKPASEQQFPMSQEAGPDIPCKVADYFVKQYNLRLMYPHLHCLQAQPKDKHRYIPMEMCIVKKGQQLKKLSEELTSQLIRYSAKPAPQREQDINKIINNLNFQADKITQAFGISVSKTMVEFNGRVLEAPSIEYKSRRTADVRDGSWNMRSYQFYTGANVRQLAMLCFDQRTRDDTLTNFCFELSKAAREAGLSLPDYPCAIRRPRRANDIHKEVESLLHQFAEIDLLIVVMPQMKSSEIYGEVKRVGDIKIGVATQCVLPKNVFRISPQTLANICQKINAKLGETNAIIPERLFSPIMKEAVIIMGADVTHPAPGDDTKPSIAAVTGSYDKQAFKYAARISMQAHRQEIIGDLKDITVQLLKNFRKKLPGAPAPKRIIFYRDGVSEGQFKDVLASELQAIQQACYACSATYTPLITFIVVQKRHHTRLFCREHRDKVGKSGNVPAGTTVDTDIVHPLEFDFYLCSHNGIQGTSRPAHYYVLYDDSNFSADAIQKLTYQLCHVYARCTRSVSIPAPAYYAHHCAFRGRCYFDRQQEHQEIPEGDRDRRVLQAMNERCLLHQDYKGMFFA